MSDESKKLENLRVVDLRNELAKRNLEKNGVKTELMERLSKALISEGHDPDTYIFDLESEKKSHSRRRRSIAESDGGDVKMDDEENNDGPNDEENDDSMTESSFCDKEDSYNTVHQAQTENNDDNRDIDVSSNVQNGNKSPELWSQNTSDEGVADKKNGLTEEVVEVPKEQRVKIVPQKTESSVDNPEQNRGADSNDEKISSDGYAAEDSVEDQSSNSQINVKQDGKELELTTKEDDDATISLTIGEDEVKQLSAESDEKLESEKKEEDPAAPQVGEAKRTNKTVTSSETKKSENVAETRTEGKKSLSAIAKSSRSLWISGLSSKTRATDLKQLFSKYGKVVSAKIVTNAKTPGARCYGYVCMLSSEEAAACISHFHLTELHDRVITVEKGKDDATGPIRLSDSKHAAETKTANAARSSDKHVAVEAKKAAEINVIEKKTADDKSIEKKSDKDKDKDKHKENEKEKEREKPLVHKETEKSESKSSGDKNKKTSSVHGSSGEQKHRSKSKSVKASESSKTVVKSVVPLDLIKKEREKIRMKERERIYREEQRRRQIERERMRQFEQRQREETLQLAKERMKLKLEREKIEQEKLELLRIERENQRLERERLQREKEDLRRTQMKLEETRRAVKRSLEMKEYEEERKRRASAERRHMHMPPSPPPPSSKKESSSRGGHGGSSMEYISRRVYETSSNSRGESSRKDHSRTETNKDQFSRYGISRVVDNSRSKAADVSHKSYSDMSRKSGDSSRYDRSGGESDAWRSSNIPVSSYSNNSASVPWSNSGSSDLRKTDNIAPWVRPNMNTSDRWPNSSSSVTVGRSGGIPMGNTGNPVFRTGYSNPMSAMDMGMCGGPYERYDSSYKQQNIVRKY